MTAAPYHEVKKSLCWTSIVLSSKSLIRICIGIHESQNLIATCNNHILAVRYKTFLTNNY